MSKVMVMNEERARADFDDFIVPGGAGNRQILHLPADDEGNEPACGDRRMKVKNRKPVAAYPKGYYPICQNCLSAVYDAEVSTRPSIESIAEVTQSD